MCFNATVLQQKNSPKEKNVKALTEAMQGDSACANQKLQYGYQALREVLELGEDADFLPDEDGRAQPLGASPAPPTHENIRGREYYRKDKQEL